MINKNQYEKSVIFIKNHVPLFVRKTYSAFSMCLDELSTELMAGAQKDETPYSADKAAKQLIQDKDFMRVYTHLFGNSRVLETRLCELCEISQTFDPQEKISRDEEFYTVNGPDIFAPVTEIKTAITPFAATSSYDGDIDRRPEDTYPIPLNFEIGVGARHIEYYRESIKDYDPFFNPNKTLEGFNGVKTVLDDLESSMVVDLKGLFNRFFKMIASGITTDLSDKADKGDSDPTRNVSKLVELSAAAKDANKSTEIVEKVTNMLYSSAITTYFVFASKLVGAKNDIYQWMYTSFVKDSVTSFDEIHYPTKAPITIASGHGVYGKANDIAPERNNAGTPEMESNPTYNDELLKLKKIMIYRNIRMQYSVWASVINAVLDPTLARGNDYFRTAESKERAAAFGLENDSLTGNILWLEGRMILAYIKARYRTYNLTQQIDYHVGKPYQSVKNIEVAVSRIKDEEAAAMVKEAISGKKIEDTLITVFAENYNTLGLGSIAVNQLSKFVLRGAYLLLMVKMIASLDKAKNVTEPTTGRPLKDLFAEVFYGILNGMKDQYKYLNTFKRDNYKLDTISKNVYAVLDEAAMYFTPVNNFNWKRESDDFNWNIIYGKMFTAETLNNVVKRVDTEDSYYLDKHNFNVVFDMPLFSDIRSFGWCFENDFTLNDCESSFRVHDMRLNSSNDQELFPKNRMILEGIERMNYNSHRSFASLESVNQAIENLQILSELGFEGADAMASNAVYSSLAGVCSGVTSLEITNEATAEKDHITIDENGNGVIENADTDSEGNIVAKSTTDTIDQANLTQHSVESIHANIKETLELNLYNQASERFNKIFNSVVLGLK